LRGLVIGLRPTDLATGVSNQPDTSSSASTGAAERLDRTTLNPDCSAVT
jgi:hypothetical protein